MMIRGGLPERREGMKKAVFRGIATALITPMRGEKIDYDALKRLLDMQLAGGVNAVVLLGTTGEGATVTPFERQEILRVAAEKIRGRVPIIVGAGSNDYRKARTFVRAACRGGADAVLLVTPYYNKASEEGAVTFFQKLADGSEKPCILYNVPSRTGFDLSAAAVERLAAHPNIAGIKEASGNIRKAAEILARCEDFPVYAGCDEAILPLLSLGGAGAISVVSNPLPRETALLFERFAAGNIAGAARSQKALLSKISALFSEVNPIPVKAVMAKMGFGENVLRLPLTPLSKERAEAVAAAVLGKEGV